MIGAVFEIERQTQGSFAVAAEGIERRRVGMSRYRLGRRNDGDARRAPGIGASGFGDAVRNEFDPDGRRARIDEDVDGRRAAGREAARRRGRPRHDPLRLEKERVEFSRLAGEAVVEARPPLRRTGLARGIDPSGGLKSGARDRIAVRERGDGRIDESLRFQKRVTNGGRQARLLREGREVAVEPVLDALLRSFHRPRREMEMQRPERPPLVAPNSHALAAMTGARPFADLRVTGARRLIARQWSDGHGFGRRRLFVVVGGAGAGPSGEIELRRLPRLQALREMLREGGRIGRQREGPDGGAGHGPVVAMLPRHVEEGRSDDIRPHHPVRLDQTFEDAPLAPAGEGVLAAPGESEIVKGIVGAVAEPDDAGVDHSRGGLHLAGAQDAERRAPLGPDGILPALAAGRAGDHDPHAVVESEGGQQTAVLVVRVSTCVHIGEDALQATQGPLKAQERRVALLPRNALVIREHPGLRSGSLPPINRAGGPRPPCAASGGSQRLG